MFAQRRVPPCFTASVAPLKTRKKDTGPEARPPVDDTMSSLGRSRENANPAPPPDLRMTPAGGTELRQHLGHLLYLVVSRTLPRSISCPSSKKRIHRPFPPHPGFIHHSSTTTRAPFRLA